MKATRCCSSNLQRKSAINPFNANPRPIAVGDILETEALAFEMDAREALANSKADEFWMFTNKVGFYDFSGDGCPWNLWVVVTQRDDMFLVVPWTGDDESKLCDNDHPDHFFLPCPVKVQVVWEEWWLYMKHISYGTPLESPPSEIYALSGFSQWRSADELNALCDTRMRRLMPGEAAKVRERIRSFLK